MGMSGLSASKTTALVNIAHYRTNVTGTDLSTSPLAPASEFLKNGLSGKYILVFTCPNGQADFLNTKHIFIYSECPKYPEICKQCNKTEKKMVL